MTENDTLDFQETQQDHFGTAITWWEKKRRWFNAVIGGLQLLLMVIYWQGTLNFGLFEAFFWSASFLVVANGLFCMGWGGEVLLKYYFKFRAENDTGRWAFLLLGIGFGVLVTMEMYIMTIGNGYF